MFNAGSRVAVCFLYRKIMLFLDKIGFVNIIYRKNMINCEDAAQVRSVRVGIIRCK